MRIGLAQINTTVGDLRGNQTKILQAIATAQEGGCELVVFPELALTGYPPLDLLRKKTFVREQRRVLLEIARKCRGIAAIVGCVGLNPRRKGRPLFNCAAVLRDGRIVAEHYKTLLPTYDVFDEDRYFSPSPRLSLLRLGKVALAVTICEDIWSHPGFPEAQLYGRNPVKEVVQSGAQIILNLSASPFHLEKCKARRKLLTSVAKAHARPVLYVNAVGGNDSLIFDGASLAIDGRGKIIAQGQSFAEDLVIVDVDAKKKTVQAVQASPAQEMAPAWQARQALILGLRDYVQKCGFEKVLIGLSGGVDSALTACLAVAALGNEKVWGVAMPSRFSSRHSQEDAELLARNLGIRFDVLPIEPNFQAFLAELKPAFGDLPFGLAEENLQARIRGTTLMALSNKFGHLVLTTGNKSEMAVGYCTLYGDMNGGLAVIADVPKMLVYEISKTFATLIPERTLTKEPSAELRPNQKDADSLPPYEVLDRILKAYIEDEMDLTQVVRQTKAPVDLVEHILQMVDRAEYKRRQSAPCLRITPKAFGLGRRLPIAQRFQETSGRKKHIAIFGGSFNPPHRGHAEVLRYLARKKEFSEIWLIPTHIHPFGKDLIPFRDRLELCRKMVEDLGRLPTPIQISTLEADLGGESRTVRTLSALHQKFPEARLSLVLGSDLKRETAKWHDFSSIENLASVVFIPRKGFAKENQGLRAKAFAPEISSSDLRQALLTGMGLEKFLTPGVLALIESKGLYGRAVA